MSNYSNKKFIILQEDDKGFMFNNKKPSGYTKIEDKDLKYKINYYIQNLSQDFIYNLNLILNKDFKIEVLSIGECKPGENGKIEACYDFDEELLDYVVGSAICVKDPKGEVKYPLSGFLPKKRIINWKIHQYRGIKNRPFKKDNSYIEKKEETVSLNKKPINVSNNENNKCNNKQLNTEIVTESINEDLIENSESNDVLDNQIDPINENINKVCEKKEIDETDFNETVNLYKNQMVNENIYREHEEKVKKIVEINKDNYLQAKTYVESLKQLLIKDDGRIEKMIKNLFPTLYNRNIKGNEDYEYRFFFNILNSFDEINSLSDDNYLFFRVNVEDFSSMENMKEENEEKYAIVYYPMLYMYPYFEEKGYFIVGLNYDKPKNITNLVYGVEVDEGNEEKFPYNGRLGFNKYIYDFEKFRGYHIMEYDYRQCVIK